MNKSTIPTGNKESNREAPVSKSSLGAFVISIIVHGLAILLVGGYVIYEGIVPKTPFLPVDAGGVALDTEVMPPPEEPADPVDTPASADSELLPSSQESSGSGEATSSDILVSSAVNTPFSLPPAVGVPGTTPKIGFGSGGSGGTEGSGSGSGPPGPSRGAIRSLFGSSEPATGRLVGTLYDFKQTKDRKPIAGEMFAANIRAFINQGETGFKRRGTFDAFYSAPMTLYATHIHIFGISADEAPAAFSVADTVEPRNWAIHYAAMVKPPKSGWYRFVGSADDYIAVGWDRKLILDSPIFGNPYVLPTRYPKESGGRPVGKPYPTVVQPGIPFDPAKANTSLAYSEWLNLSDSREYRLDVVIGERPGGGFHANLMIEELGVEYKMSPERVPKYPIFKTAPKVALSEGNRYYPASADGPVFTATGVPKLD